MGNRAVENQCSLGEQNNFDSFKEARNSSLSLPEIKEQIRLKAKEQRTELISASIINALHSKSGLSIVSGDMLSYINALTLKGNHILWNKEADEIWPGDSITIEGCNVYRTHNQIKVMVGTVKEGFEQTSPSKTQVAVNSTNQVDTTVTTQDEQNVNDTTPITQAKGTSIEAKDQTKQDTQTSGSQKPINQKNTTQLIKEVKLPDTQTTYLYVDEATYLVGEDGTRQIQNKELSNEDRKFLKSYEKVALLNEIIEIWRNKAQAVADGLHSKNYRNDDEIITTQIQDIEKSFKNIYINVQKKGNIETEIDNIFKYIQIAEAEENIIGSKDMRKVQVILGNSKDKDDKLTQIYNLMRYGGISGNSKDVKEKLSHHILKVKEFADVKNILTNNKVINYITNYNESELEKLIGKEQSDAILEAYGKIKIKQERKRSEYSKMLKTINDEKKKNGETEIELNDFINLNTNFAALNILKHMLIRDKLEKQANRGTVHSYTGLYADIAGLGETESGDYLNIADENIDTAIDVGNTLALATVSMGVGFLAARGALYTTTYIGNLGINILDKTSKGKNFLGKAKNWKKSLAIGKFSGIAGIEGVAFYEGSNITHNLIYGNGDILKNATNGKEIIKSIAFMGIMRGVGKVIAKIKTIPTVTSLTQKVPNVMLKGKTPALVLAEAGLLTGTSVGLEFAFEGEGEWSWSEYLQALAMVGIFKGAGKVNFSKTKDGIKATLENKVINEYLSKVPGLTEKGKTLLLNAIKKITPSKTTLLLSSLSAVGVGGKLAYDGEKWETVVAHALGALVIGFGIGATVGVFKIGGKLFEVTGTGGVRYVKEGWKAIQTHRKFTYPIILSTLVAGTGIVIYNNREEIENDMQNK